MTRSGLRKIVVSPSGRPPLWYALIIALAAIAIFSGVPLLATTFYVLGPLRGVNSNAISGIARRLAFDRVTNGATGRTAFGQLVADDSGQDLVEYALLILFVVLASVAVWHAIAGAVGAAYLNYDSGVQDLWEPDPPGSGL